jgi:hypothetical protein
MNIRLTASLCLVAFAASIASAPAHGQLSSNATVYAFGLESPVASNSARTAISTSPKQGPAELSQPSAPAPRFRHPSAPISAATPDASRNWIDPATAPQSPPDSRPASPPKAWLTR